MATRKVSFLDWHTSLGFSSNPFTVHALRADEMGRRLMVGRDDQVELVAKRLHKDGKITCLDGHVGVGKTSLVNVAAYECFQAYLHGDTAQLLIPLNDSFQLSKDEDVDSFCEKVFRRVATGLLAHRDELVGRTLPSKVLQNLNAWMNSPVIEYVNDSIGATIGGGIPGIFSASVKGDASKSRQINTGTGFTKEGLEQLIRKWLNEIFVVQGSGGVICVIDNLELLESGSNARRLLEALRDRLFNVNGLRWVFCGANGVIHSLAASARLGSFLNTPIIDVHNISPSSIEDLVRTRLNEFSQSPENAEEELPIRIADISTLYPIINFNLRDLLHYVEDYCEHQFNAGKSIQDDNQKASRFAKWLEKLTTESYSTLSSRVAGDAWAVLDVAMSSPFKGTFGIGDYGSFNRNSKAAIPQKSFERWLKDFVKLGLITKNIDDTAAEDDGFKRDVFAVTAKGALVHYARLLKQENQSLAPVDWLRRVHNI